jgi:hypothetical protein
MMQATNDATFTGVVTFVCPSQLPTLTSCSFTPATINFTAPNQTIPFTASIMTTSRKPVKNPASTLPSIDRPRTRGESSRFPALATNIAISFAAIFMLGLCAWMIRWSGNLARPKMRASQRRWLSVSALLVAVAAIAFVGGCYKHKNTLTGTPAGSANLTLQATAQGATRPIGITIVVK